MRILITGKNGLVGSSIFRSREKFDHELIFVGRDYKDLSIEANVSKMFMEIKPDYVVHTAAKVGGIYGNMLGYADYFYQNILMNTYMIHYSALYGVKKMLAFSSVCVFPDNIQILSEDVMHRDEPFDGNFAYAYAKRMIDVQIRAYKKQHKIKNFCSIIPGNIYGPNDMYNLVHGHVIPCLIHKIFIAKSTNSPLIVWGDGRSLREFIYVDDLTSIIMDLLNKDEIPERLIISGNQEVSIKEVVHYLCEIADFDVNMVIWDEAKPNGQRTRPSDKSLLNSLFPDFEYTNLKSGLKKSYEWFVNNYPNVRLN